MPPISPGAALTSVGPKPEQPDLTIAAIPAVDLAGLYIAREIVEAPMTRPVASFIGEITSEISTLDPSFRVRCDSKGAEDSPIAAWARIAVSSSLRTAGTRIERLRPIISLAVYP